MSGSQANPDGSPAGSRHIDVAILQPGYLPWLGYFDLVALADHFIIYDDVQFDRGGWRNRNRLLGHPEPTWITVPVLKSGRAFEPLRETRIVPGTWPKKQAMMLKTIYGRAPHFKWCFPVLEEYLLARQYELLMDLCLEGHQRICGLLGLSPTVKMASELGHQAEGRTARLVSLCRDLSATRYISGNAAKDYMEEELWKTAGIELVYQSYPHPEYPQFKPPFQSHLSVVDALMFAGPEARKFMGISHSKPRAHGHSGAAP